MPIKRVTKNGQNVGWQYGNQKVFPTKAQAVAQMRAIHAQKKK